jgi:glyoxylase-like metal-dependent hydrolase (beta-lactamase superfamily II)
MSNELYEVYAIRYATRDGTRSANFIGGDPHDGPMPMDYFVWLIRDAERAIVVDTGFTAEVAVRRKRRHIREPKAGLALLGVRADEVRDVVITHMHYDHVGTLLDFPLANFHIQDEEMRFVTGRDMRHACFADAFEVEDVVGMVRMLFKGRVFFHRGEEELAPGVSLHHIGGHTPGQQSVRVLPSEPWRIADHSASGSTPAFTPMVKTSATAQWMA